MTEKPSGSSGHEKSDGRRKLPNRRRAIQMLAGTIAAPFVAEGVARLPDLDQWRYERGARQRFEHLSRFENVERERKIAAETGVFRSFVQSSEGKRIAESGIDQEIFKFLYRMPPVLRKHVEGTTYDIPISNWPSILLSVSEDDGAVVIKTADVFQNPEVLHGSNGVLIEPRIVLTNWHVLRSKLRSVERSKKDPQELGRIEDEVRTLADISNKIGVDAAVATVPEKFQNLRARTLPLASLSDNEINGNFIRVAGIDPDESAGLNGTKLYASCAVRVTKRMARFIEEHDIFSKGRKGDVESQELSIREFENSFVFLLPPGEGIWHNRPPRYGPRAIDMLLGGPEKDQARLGGMSGSPVLLDDRMVGVIFRGAVLEYRGVLLEVAFFHGPDQIRRARDAGLSYTFD